MQLLPPDTLPDFLLGTWGQQPFRLGRSLVGRQQVALSEDGETLWYFEGYKLVTLDARSGLARSVVTPAWGLSVERIARTADDALLLVGRTGAAWYEPRRGALLGALHFERNECWAIAASPADPARGACVTVRSFATPCGYTFSRADGVARPLTLTAQDGVARALAFTPDGATLLVLCARALLRFDVSSGARLAPIITLDATHAASDELLAFTLVDAQMAVVVTLLGTALAIDLHRGDVCARAPTAGPRHALALGVSCDGGLVVARSNALDRYDLPALKPAGSIEGDFALWDDGDLVVDPSRPVAWAVDLRGALQRIDLATRTVTTAPPAGFPAAVAWSGEALRVARHDSPVETVDLRTGVSSFTDIGQGINPIAFSDNGDAVFVGVDRSGRWRSLRDGAEGSLLPMHAHPTPTADGCWSLSPRGLEDGSRVVPLARCKNPRALAVSPSGRLALVVCASEGIVVDLREGAERARYKLAGGGFARFVSEEEAVVVGPRGARWIEVGTGAVRSHAKRAVSERAAVSRDGQVLANAFSVEHVMLLTRDRPDDPVSFVAAWHPKAMCFSEDGARLAVMGHESVVRVFDVAAALATRPPPRQARR